MHFWIVISIFSILGTCHKDKEISKLSYDSISSDSLTKIIVGAQRTDQYLPLIQNKTVALVVNHTSLIGSQHLVDSLLQLSVQIKSVFAPEHGFRGTADAGEKIDDIHDNKTGLPIISLYGNKKKPTADDLKGVDVLIFDIQDVGVRFYTYISTLHYVMEAAAENNIPLIVLDRPNPNAHYIDGPVLEEKYKSFVGMHHVPVVYGMTIGEYAQMINGEGWLQKGQKCNLTVIPCDQYNHQIKYELPVKPSPNLPNFKSVLLYPSVCFFEGTTVSVGRGTDAQFQIIGHPKIKSTFSFTPLPNEGAKTPPHNGIVCYGTDLTSFRVDDIRKEKRINLSYLLDYYEKLTSVEEKFFLDNLFFDKLAGTDQLRKQIISGLSIDEIRKSWESDLDKFKVVRAKYLIY